MIPALVLVARSELTLPAYLPAIVQWAASLLANPLWVRPALIVLAKLVRGLLIQFPGDVAIYVDSNKLDRFCKIRHEIKQIASDSVTGSIRLAVPVTPHGSTQKLPSSDIPSAP